MTGPNPNDHDQIPMDFLEEMEADAVHRQDLPEISKPGRPQLPIHEVTVRPFNIRREHPAIINDCSMFPFKGTFKPAQVKGLREAGLKKGHAFWIDPGGGKTGAGIAEASYLWQENMIDGVIWFGPNGPHEQVIDEQFPKWCAVKWRGIHNKMGKRDLEGFFGRANDDLLPVLAVNYEGLITPTGRKLVDRFRKRFRRIYLVADEASKLKSYNSKRTERVTEEARLSAYVRMMSGTPILKGLEDLFSEYDIMKPGLTGFAKYTAYRNYYCQTVTPIGKQVDPWATQIVGYRNEEELRRRTAPYVTVVKAKEFRPESNPTFMQVHCPMKEDQKVAYRRMEKTLLTEIDGRLITAKTALVKLGKLLQIASGFAFDNDGNEIFKWSNKINAVMNILDELDEPVIVFAPYVPMLDELERVIRARDDRPFFRYRDRSTVREWKEAGGVILGNQGSGLGIGQNLQNAAATIYASNSFSAEARWQSLARTDREGQDRQCRYWDCVTRGTADMKTLENLARKEEISRANIDSLREYLT